MHPKKNSQNSLKCAHKREQIFGKLWAKMWNNKRQNQHIHYIYIYNTKRQNQHT
jgi:hypothetical protein